MQDLIILYTYFAIGLSICLILGFVYLFRKEILETKVNNDFTLMSGGELEIVELKARLEILSKLAELSTIASNFATIKIMAQQSTSNEIGYKNSFKIESKISKHEGERMYVSTEGDLITI
jgi:hypothetical protein